MCWPLLPVNPAPLRKWSQYLLILLATHIFVGLSKWGLKSKWPTCYERLNMKLFLVPLILLLTQSQRPCQIFILLSCDASRPVVSTSSSSWSSRTGAGSFFVVKIYGCYWRPIQSHTGCVKMRWHIYLSPPVFTLTWSKWSIWGMSPAVGMFGECWDTVMAWLACFAGFNEAQLWRTSGNKRT